MKKRWKLLLTLGLALMAVGLLLVVGVAQYPYPTLPDNMVQAHKDSGDLTTQQCVKCHGDKRVEASGQNTHIYSAHKRHNMSVYLRFNLPTPFDNDGDGQIDEDPPDGVDNPQDLDGDTTIAGIDGL